MKPFDLEKALAGEPVVSNNRNWVMIWLAAATVIWFVNSEGNQKK